jgi:pyridinium-3,5-biscarboxylic acid mononucleotide sulfurtransferase
MLARPRTVESEEAVIARLRAGGRALVALSGGVDSSLVASLASVALGSEAVAVTLTGIAVSAAEIERATSVAHAIGIEHHLVAVDPLARAEYRANPSNRCYFCREGESVVLRSFGGPREIRQYLDGIHLDDLSDDRPGVRAMDEAGFVHPLVLAGWGKQAVREAARRRGLPNWDEPSDACLASRITHGQPISAELLGRVERAEARVRAAGFRRVRVRVTGDEARVEVDPSEVPRLLTEPLASRLDAEVRAVGFTRVLLDPRGYHAAVPRSGEAP